VMLARFLAEEIDAGSGTASLSAEESHHLTHVLRLGAGDEVAIFDGAGREFRARVDRVSRGAVTVRLLDEIAAAPEPAVRLTLAQAVLKGERMDDVVRDATMMGVAAIEPIVTEHTTVALKALERGRPGDRWRRIAVASAKQCRRAVLPAVGSGTALADWMAQDASEVRLLLIEPSATVQGHPPAVLDGEARPASATLMVGPEGGWTAAEIQSAVAAGYVPISLGRRTLRADAVALIAIGVLQFVWGDL
jgi:16S rRNA (uracil1498-N3)-methyltransferase